MRSGIFGLTEGVNYPKRKDWKNESFLDLSSWSDVIIVDRWYFLEHQNELKQWAEDMERIDPVTYRVKKR
jgi:hypothetical protein